MHLDLGYSLESQLRRYGNSQLLSAHPPSVALTDSVISGVSLLTQVLYAFVFLTRYLDLFRGLQWTDGHAYNNFFKLFYIFSSIYIIVVMIYAFPRTREREKSWKLASWCVLGALVGAPSALALYGAAYKLPYPRHWFTEVLLPWLLVPNPSNS